MSSRLFLIALVAFVSASGSHPSADAQTRTGSHEAQQSFVGKVWMSTDGAAAPGTLRIFLQDGTLLMDSCGETYRLARWRAIDERRIEWQEDSARIKAEVTQASRDQLQLRTSIGR